MSDHTPDQLAREVRDGIVAYVTSGVERTRYLAALAELEAMASARNDDVSLLVGAYYGEVPSETMELAQAAARLRASAAVSSPPDQEEA